MQPILFPGADAVSADLGVSAAVFSLVFVVLMAITVVLKGFALWFSARNGQKYWFIALLVINLFGILEIIYLIWFRKPKNANHTDSLFDNAAERESSPAA